MSAFAYTAETEMLNDKVVNDKETSVPATRTESVHSADAGPATGLDANEIFKVDEKIRYRTMGWMKACILFVKMEFALGVLSIPSNMNTLGAVGGSILVIVWGALSTYGAYIMGKFRLNHASIHSVGDAGHLIGGPILGETVGAAYFISWVLPAGVSMLGVSIAFNAVTDHAACSMVWTTVALVVCVIPAALPRFGQIAVLTWFGFFSMFVAVLLVVISVTQTQPYAAPIGETDYGFKAIAYPTFTAGLTASNIILGSYGGTPAFMSAAAEMRNPKDYPKSLVISMAITTACYIAFGLVVYAYCGQYVASPALGSAGPLIKKIAYGLALPGLLISRTLFLHISAKHLFVRILKNTAHLQNRTRTHFLVWYTSVFSIAVVAFVLASGIPFFNSLLGLLVVFVSPNTLSLPMAMWFYENKVFKRKPSLLAIAFHGLVLVVGLLCGIGGFVSAVIDINNLFKAGNVGTAFACADNSN